MKVLLVNPEFPESFWSLTAALPFTKRKTGLPSLGLLTVAALLPRHWDLRLVDLNVRPVTDEELRRADVVMLTGMLVQRPSLHDVVARCRRLGVRTVVGGPYASSLPDELWQADTVVIGEAEDLASELVSDLERGCPKPVYRETEKPDVTRSPVPRFDLVEPNTYAAMSLQYSRGCPFLCEFCDITVLYGRRPRTKTAAQVVAELDAIVATGFSGNLFFSDDNFIANKVAVKTVLPEIAAWRRRGHQRMHFMTQASINLAGDPELVEMMTSAGFDGVFIGIETPSEESLRETRKVQNLKRDLVDQIRSLQARGIGVAAGFIVGFDNDGPDIFDRIIDFIGRAAIPSAMVGVLGAPPKSPLYERLEREGRLRPEVSGDSQGLTNVITKLPTDELLTGYRRVLATLYDPARYFERCRDHLTVLEPAETATLSPTWYDLANALRAMRAQAFAAPYRREYRRFLWWVLRHRPRRLAQALMIAGGGHGHITWVRDVALPNLDREREEQRRAATRPTRPAARAGTPLVPASISP